MGVSGLIEARKIKGLSQAEVSAAIGVSRPTYIKIEKGEKEPTVGQAQILARLLNIDDAAHSVLTEKASGEDDEECVARYKQIILNCIKYGSDSSDNRITKTKLAKLVYLADYIWYYFTGESMSKMRYRRLENGPVPDIYFRVMDELELNEAVNCDIHKKGHMYSLVEINPPRGKLKEKEIELIEAIGDYWKDKSTQDIVDFTHEQLPWKICRKGEIIPYDLIAQEDPDKVYGGIRLQKIFR